MKQKIKTQNNLGIIKSITSGYNLLRKHIYMSELYSMYIMALNILKPYVELSYFSL